MSSRMQPMLFLYRTVSSTVARKAAVKVSTRFRAWNYGALRYAIHSYLRKVLVRSGRNPRHYFLDEKCCMIMVSSAKAISSGGPGRQK